MNRTPLIPGPPAAASRRLDIEQTLKPVIRAIGLTRLARGALLGFAVGAIVGTAVLGVARIRPFDYFLSVALLSLAAGVLAGAAWGLARWPRAAEAARTADLYFGLDDRLTTALELRSSQTPVARAQSRDAAQRIDGLALGRSRGRWLRRSEVGVALIAILALAGSLALGSPGRAHHASTTTEAAKTQLARRAAAKQVQKLRSELHLGLTPGQQQSNAIRKLDSTLARLRHQLLQSSSTRASLRAISATQQQLHQIARGLHPINAKAVAQLNGSLAHYLGQRSGSSKQSASARSAAATAQALSRLAQSLAHLTPAQRAAAARALARASNTTSNTSLRSLLRQAASSLADGNPRAAGAAVQRAAQLLSRSAGAQAAQSSAGAAAAQLGALKSQLAGSGPGLPSGQLANTPGHLNSRTGIPGPGNRSGQSGAKGTAPGKGQGKGSGRGLGQARGSGTRPGRGNGRGQGRGGRNGQGVAPRSGKGTSGAHGSGGRGRSGRTHRGRNVTVFIPGKQGKGSEIVRNGPNGAPQQGALVPYQQVLGQYTQGAHQALDRAALPPPLQTYVRRYFSTISH